MALERLQKIIAAAGIASRRKAEEMIQQGLVSVNGKTVTELGSKADPESDSIRVNERLLKGPERHEYFVLNKPRGYVTTVSDPEGRPTVMELLQSKARLYPVGRLDFNSEGLLVLTNDGALAHKLMKAASHIAKTYLVKVAGQPEEAQLRRLRAGVSIAEERDPGKRVRTAPAQIRVIKEAENPWLEVTLHEGRNRQIRKMFEEVGHHVEKIRRVRYGPLELDLPPGESRRLTARELSMLQRATEPQQGTRFERPPREFAPKNRRRQADSPQEQRHDRPVRKIYDGEPRGQNRFAPQDRNGPPHRDQYANREAPRARDSQFGNRPQRRVKGRGRYANKKAANEKAPRPRDFQFGDRPQRTMEGRDRRSGPEAPRPRDSQFRDRPQRRAEGQDPRSNRETPRRRDSGFVDRSRPRTEAPNRRSRPPSTREGQDESKREFGGERRPGFGERSARRENQSRQAKFRGSPSRSGFSKRRNPKS